MLYKFLSFIFLLLFTFSCQKERNCNCPLKTPTLNVSQQDSTSITKDLSADWGVNGKVSTVLKKLLYVEVGANVHGHFSHQKMQNIISTVRDTFPQYECEVFQSKLGTVFFCAYFDLCCQDPVLTRSEIRDLCDSRLIEFKKEIRENCQDSETVLIPSTPELNQPTEKFEVTLSLEENMINGRILVDNSPARVLDRVGTIGTDGHIIVEVDEKKNEPHIFSIETKDRCFQAEFTVTTDIEIRNYYPCI